MDNCVVPSLINLSWQRQEQAEEEEGNNIISRSSHHLQTQQIPTCVVPMSSSKYEATELRWENENIQGRQDLGGMFSFPTPTTKPTWDTLESSVVPELKATTCRQQHQNTYLLQHHQQNQPNRSSMPQPQPQPQPQVASEKLKKKRMRPEPDLCVSARASRVSDSMTMKTTWTSSESLHRVKKKITDDYYAKNGNQENEAKWENVGSQMTRSSRRRRDKIINQKMKALQKLVPNASKIDKVLILDKAIEYLKELQTQVQMMITVRNNIYQMMMPLAEMQQLQMSLLTRMGMGLGMGTMFDMNHMARINATHQPFPSGPGLLHPVTMMGAMPSFVSPPFVMPPAIPTHQTMNMDVYNKIAALYQEQANSQQISEANHV